MTSAYYTSLSGMLAASYGLQNTSNNVSNMQNTGFKRTEVFYSTLGNSSGDEGLGYGVKVGGNSINFAEGNHLSTQKPSDLAISGDGFFIIQLKSGELLYTRNGDFVFNQEGLLSDKRTGGLVQGYDYSGNLVPIHQQGPKIVSGRATHEISLDGSFVAYEKTPESDPTNPSPKKEYSNVVFKIDSVYDKEGKAHSVTLEFKAYEGPNGTPSPGSEFGDSWELVKVLYDGVEIYFEPNQLLVFSIPENTPNSENNSIKLNLNDNQDLLLHFGSYWDSSDNKVKLSKTKQQTEETKITVSKNDGYSFGTQSSFSFDDNGQISYNYSNNQSVTGIYVGLARFDDVQNTLTATPDNLFRAKSEIGRHLGRANKDGFGSIQAGFIESSNVDSTAEFANIVILQRMFQACSQIMDIDKQLLEGLIEK